MNVEIITSKWRQDYLSGKRMFFIECPYVSHNGNTLIFEFMGFDIIRYQTPCQKLDKLPDEIGQQPLIDFQVIVICISGGTSTAQSVFVSEHIIENLKKYMQDMNISVPILGMNLSLSGAKQITQAKIFNNLFIGGDTSDEQIRLIFEDIFNQS